MNLTNPVGLGVSPSLACMVTLPVRRSGTDRPTGNGSCSRSSSKGNSPLPLPLNRYGAVVLLSLLCALTSGCVANHPSPRETTSIPNDAAAPEPLPVTSISPQPADSPPAAPVPTVASVSEAPDVEPAGEVTTDFPPLPVPPKLATPAEEVVQLAQARVPNDVLLAYIEGSTSRFDLGAEQILYLTDLGVPAETIAAMVRRDQALRDESSVTAPAAPPAVEQAMAEPAEMTEADTSPTQTVAVAAEGEGLPPAFAVMPTAETVPTQPVPQPQQVTHNHFYSALSPYGTWRELPAYGWVWQPSAAVVEPEWRPYLNGGRWLWTDHGWYWHSYYSWGWAPFHYGRWHRSPSWGCR